MTTQNAAENESQTYFFTARELKRMVAYRAAVEAHFYTDECTPAPTPIRPTIDAVRLLRAIRATEPAA
jgi:hypothetical protein